MTTLDPVLATRNAHKVLIKTIWKAQPGTVITTPPVPFKRPFQYRNLNGFSVRWQFFPRFDLLKSNPPKPGPAPLTTATPAGDDSMACKVSIVLYNQPNMAAATITWAANPARKASVLSTGIPAV